MAGVVIGSLIAKYNDISKTIRAVATTVNNECNLSCPHCYLQYDGPKKYISTSIQAKITSLDVDHVAIVGMEPFVNRKHAEQTLQFANNIRNRKKSISAITNGFGLNFLNADELQIFDYIDVSVDGGENSYRNFRGASFDKLVRTLRTAVANGAQLRALNTLCTETAAHIDETLTACSADLFEKVYFSPYVAAESHGRVRVSGLNIPELLRRLATSQAFRADPRTTLLLDAYHLFYEGVSENFVRQEVRRLGLDNKVLMIPHTPLTLGIVRVTYEGQILPPETAIHPARYREWDFHISEDDLASAYAAFCAHEAETMCGSQPLAA